MEVMMESGKKRQEMNRLYGQTTIALVNANAHLSATQTRLTITKSEWAAGFWAGMQNARFDAYENDGATQLNTTGSLNVVTSNAAQTTVTFSGASGDITAVEAYANSNPDKTQLYFYDALGNESPGVKAQLVNSGTLFGISGAAYDLWNGTQYNANGALTFAVLQDAVAAAVARGLDEEVDVDVNPGAWADLLTDQAANRRYVNSGTEFKNGAEVLSFYGQNGPINIIAHIFVKQGDAFILPMSRVKRIGVAEMGFNIPGTEKGTVFIQLQSNLAFEYRCYSQETIFIETPARAVYVNGIVND